MPSSNRKSFDSMTDLPSSNGQANLDNTTGFFPRADEIGAWTKERSLGGDVSRSYSPERVETATLVFLE